MGRELRSWKNYRLQNSINHGRHFYILIIDGIIESVKDFLIEPVKKKKKKDKKKAADSDDEQEEVWVRE